MDAHHYTSRVDGVTLKLAHGERTHIQHPPCNLPALFGHKPL